MEDSKISRVILWRFSPDCMGACDASFWWTVIVYGAKVQAGQEMPWHPSFRY
ncbi:MAG: hypothetical protein KDC70_09655 [Saprospiraceae bacterium]|nr:hypothetical protein [Saprospiraceae bacterium]